MREYWVSIWLMFGRLWDGIGVYGICGVCGMRKEVCVEVEVFKAMPLKQKKAKEPLPRPLLVIKSQGGGVESATSLPLRPVVVRLLSKRDTERAPKGIY